MIFRGGGGIFYDRPDGNTVFSIPGNPPIATSRRPADRPVPEPEPGPELPAGPGHAHLPVRREGSGLGAVGGRHPEDAAVGVRRGRLLRRQPRLQPSRRVPERHAGQPQRDRLRRGLSAAEPGPDARSETVPGAGAYTTNLLRAYPRSRQHQPEHHRVPATPTTRSRATSTAASATGSASASTTR